MEKLLTIDDLVKKSGFSKSYFYCRKNTGAGTLKFVFTRPLKTTEAFYNEWIEEMAKSRGVKAWKKSF